MQHLALIMDGNRRWATKRSLRPWLGHDAGAQTIKEVIKFCLDKSISYLSLYAFSLENFNRSEQEISFLFELFLRHAQTELPEIMAQGICIKFIGDKALFPAQLTPMIDYIQKQTRINTHLLVHILFCYGAQQEIVDAVKKITYAALQGTLDPDKITPAVLTDSMWSGAIPNPDLIIRTGGKKRLSNFLLFQAAYSELCFLDCLWPDLRYQDIQKAYEDFTYEQRNFGF